MPSASEPDGRTVAAGSDLQDSLVVMDIADRLRRRDAELAQATDVSARRQMLKQRLRQLYERQQMTVSDDTLEQAIDQRLSQRLTYQPARGLSAWLARLYVRWVGSHEPT